MNYFKYTRLVNFFVQMKIQWNDCFKRKPVSLQRRNITVWLDMSQASWNQKFENFKFRFLFSFVHLWSIFFSDPNKSMLTDAQVNGTVLRMFAALLKIARISKGCEIWLEQCAHFWDMCKWNFVEIKISFDFLLVLYWKVFSIKIPEESSF